MTRTLHFALLAAILLGSFAQASEEKDRDAELFEVREEQVPREIELEGTFEATETAEIVVRPKEWSNLVVERAVPPGTRVAQDEPVLWLETLKIDEQIADLRFEKELGKLQLQETESALAHFRTTLPLELRTSELAARTADEDYAYFREVGEPTSRKQTEFQVISAERSLEYVREELEQLKKMYRDDDLTEETEEIILRRAQHQVESAEFRLERAKIQADQTLEMDLPRRAQSLQDDVERTRLEYEKLIDSSARTMNQRKIELERARHNQEKTALRLENLQHDREQMTVRAPIEGVINRLPAETGDFVSIGGEVGQGKGFELPAGLAIHPAECAGPHATLAVARQAVDDRGVVGLDRQGDGLDCPIVDLK
jgi:HlyD family secretion protein